MRVACGCRGVFSLLIHSVLVTFTHTVLIRQSLEDYPLSLCTDSRPASYFHSWHFRYQPHDVKKFIIYLQPGGYCHNIETCVLRCDVAPFMCTAPSDDWMENQHGLLSDDEHRNPYFYDYFKVVIPYCSADMYTGSRLASHQTGGFSFLGRHILLDTLTSLNTKFNIMAADQVIFSGSSAGGAGVAFNCNLLHQLLPDIEVSCVVDGAFFYPRSEAYQQQSECETIDDVLTSGSHLWNAPDVAEFDLHSAWWEDIEPGLLICVASVDQFGFESYCGNESKETEQASWAQGTRNMARGITASHSHIGLFMPACYDHMLLLDDVMFGYVPVGPENVTLSRLLHHWVRGQGPRQAWDDCSGNITFCNDKCPNKVTTYTDMKYV